MAGAGLRLSIDPAEWNRFYSDLRRFEPALARGLRTHMREAANKAVERVTETLQEPTPELGTEVQTRQSLIDNTKVSLSFGIRAANVTIKTTSAGLDDAHKALVLVYDKPTFRHPVFASGAWVSEEGRPYFGSQISKAMDEGLYDQMSEALGEAAAAMGVRAL